MVAQGDVSHQELTDVRQKFGINMASSLRTDIPLPVDASSDEDALGGNTAEDGTGNASNENDGSGAVGSDARGSTMSDEEAQNFSLIDMEIPDNMVPILQEETTTEQQVLSLRNYIKHAMDVIGKPGKFSDLLTFWSIKAQNAALLRVEGPY